MNDDAEAQKGEAASYSHPASFPATLGSAFQSDTVQACCMGMGAM